MDHREPRMEDGRPAKVEARPLTIFRFPFPVRGFPFASRAERPVCIAPDLRVRIPKAVGANFAVGVGVSVGVSVGVRWWLGGRHRQVNGPQAAAQLAAAACVAHGKRIEDREPKLRWKTGEWLKPAV